MSVGLRRVAFFILLALVTWLSVAPNPPEAESGSALTAFLSVTLFGDAAYADKVAHFIAYAALGGSAALAEFTRKVAIWPAAGLALWGAGLEGVQFFIAERSADGGDALANGIGAVAGFMVGAGMLALLARRRVAAKN